MKNLFFHFDQSSLVKRLFGLLVVLFSLTLVWYFVFASSLWHQINTKKMLKIYGGATVSQLAQLSGQKKDFAFSHDLAQLKLKHVLESLTSDASDLTVTNFTDAPNQIFPAGAAEFPLASQALGVQLLPSLSLKTVRMKFNGGFYSFRDYLKAIQTSPYSIYFERVDFNMSAYPKADIMLEVFTLGGGR